jgi:hypothetical protein
MSNEQPKGTTYAAWAEADLETSMGGRFARPKPEVAPMVVPHWSAELASVPDEPPLGYAVDAPVVDENGRGLGGAGGQGDE